ncbi:thyrotropin-releasing hormone receptor-like isoform X2 [Dreissena polymorpha]|uniref:thyrotropin-releasing hormone receptor-like isoform X2 n=1 Tax=Dreissena polymorpha TaxID=45954 RepID=UPI00226566D8|nr:thyrotropin-releasing hormone receptor-like isoform X2 [Dreissena polymorpha]
MTVPNNTTMSPIVDQHFEIFNETRSSVSSLERILIATLLSPIIVLGIVGNIFSLLVWIKGRRRKTSTARYLSALAVADILVLGIPATEFWIDNVLEIFLSDTNNVACRSLSYCLYLLPAISAWILVTVTIERTISVWCPHRVSVVCRPNIAVILVMYLPVYMGSGLRRFVNVPTNGDVPDSQDECEILTSSLFGISSLTMIFVDLCVLFVFPFIIILICNISILLKVICVKRMRRNTLQERGGQQNSSRQNILKTVTCRIIILSTAFLICNAPLLLFNALDSYESNVSVDDANVYSTVFHICMFLNNGVNFLLYCLIGSGFRKDFIGIF